jgi:hypothetical protein
VNPENLTALLEQAATLREEAQAHPDPTRAIRLRDWAARLEQQVSRLERALPGPREQQVA